MELIKVGILGYSGFLGARLSNDLRYKFKIKKVKKNIKNEKKQKISILICCAGPDKFWCLKNKKKIKNQTYILAKNIIDYSTKNKVNKIIYFSSIHVLKNLDKDLIPYVNWHKIMEQKLQKSNLKILVIRLPNIFGKPKEIKKNFWNFFVNSIIKKSVIKKKLIIKNDPLKKLFAYPLNYFVKFITRELKNDNKRKIRIINLNKNFLFQTNQLIFIIKKIMHQKNIFLKYEFKNKKIKKIEPQITLKSEEKKFFEEEVINLLKFGKKIFND